jgi:3-hydroxyisobutyrate dehydrogenase-like beta-hydroxyacid dehydrogenase
VGDCDRALLERFRRFTREGRRGLRPRFFFLAATRDPSALAGGLLRVPPRGKLRGVKIGLLHPGEMGAAVGSALRAGGEPVLWASEGRGTETTGRAVAAGLEDVETVAELCRRSDVLISLCPPYAAVDVARACDGFAGLYVDANAVSPATARAIAPRFDRFVDGGVVGPPPRQRGTTRLYLSGGEAGAVAALFAGTALDARVVGVDAGAASAVKMAFAAWTKGSAALLLAARAVADANGVESVLVEEWRTSLPELDDRLADAARSAVGKGWRWIGEMEEIAETFAAAGLPSGFHLAAADVYRRVPRGVPDAEALEHVLSALLAAAR